MNILTICIPTYKRPEMLKKLVESIASCHLDKLLIGDVNLIIVDNDADKSAESIIAEFKHTYYEKFGISYYDYPLKGLSNVRNELLKKALLHNPDFIVFVDDDEYVTVDWLNELVGTIISNKGDMAMGPVHSIPGINIPEYISCWFERDDYPDNYKLNFIRSGNLIIRTKSLLKYNVWFDPRFNITGGEDSYFGLQMIKQGASIFWASKAVAYETVPENRANIKWLSRRYYNGANKFAYILKLDNNKKNILKKIFVSLFYIIAGFFALPLISLPLRKRYWGLLKLAEGLGGLAGLFSIRYSAYK